MKKYKVKSIKDKCVCMPAVVMLHAFCFMLPAHATRIPELSATVDYVLDGDTFSAQVSLENGAQVSVRVRIRNIDAPEIHGECEFETELAKQSKMKLAALIPKGSNVRLSKIKDDKYLGRIDALAMLDDGRDVGRIMIEEKLARWYNGGKRLPWCPVLPSFGRGVAEGGGKN